MPLPAGNGVQSPLNLALPFKSWLKFKETETEIHLRVRKIFESADAIGTLHFARFFDLEDHNQMGFFTVYDGSFTDYMDDFLKDLGPLFNSLNEHVVGASPSPIEKHVDEWMKWVSDIELDSIGFYSAYPTLSVQDIMTSAGVNATGRGKTPVQSPLTVLFPAKSPNHLAAMTEAVGKSVSQLFQAADAIGTLHFARFMPLSNKELLLIAEHDGTVEKLCQDLSARVGPMFDQIFENVVGAPPNPVQKDVSGFARWVNERNIKPWAFYTAYPSLTVQNIRALKAKAA